MTDENAVKLANLLGAYAASSIKEGATVAEVGGWSVASVVSDIVQTTPQYLEGGLSSWARELAEQA